MLFGISVSVVTFLILISWTAIATAQPFASDPRACDLAASPAQGEWKPLTLPDDTKVEWRIGMNGEDLRFIHLRYPDASQGRFLIGIRAVRCGKAFPQDAAFEANHYDLKIANLPDFEWHRYFSLNVTDNASNLDLG